MSTTLGLARRARARAPLPPAPVAFAPGRLGSSIRPTQPSATSRAPNPATSTRDKTDLKIDGHPGIRPRGRSGRCRSVVACRQRLRKTDTDVALRSKLEWTRTMPIERSSDAARMTAMSAFSSANARINERPDRRPIACSQTRSRPMSLVLHSLRSPRLLAHSGVVSHARERM